MGLRQRDLEDLVYDVFEIDSYKSKMGDDADIVTLSFSVKEQAAAKDLENFLEKGYIFVLDAEATAGEQRDGTYKVFIEIERDRQAIDQILEIADGIYKITNIDQLKFRYYKNWRSKDLTKENLEQVLPLDSKNYGLNTNESNMSNYKNFFNKSFVESIDMWDDILRIKKSYAEPVYFKFINFGDAVSIKNNIVESLDVNGFSEVIYLSKYIGDYNITKYGNKIVMENNDKAVVLERIQT